MASKRIRNTSSQQPKIDPQRVAKALGAKVEGQTIGGAGFFGALQTLVNVGYVCPEHAPKPGKYKGQAPETFIGKYVKLCFETGLDPKVGSPQEHMWVHVEGLFTEGAEELVGTVNNDPIYAVQWPCGTTLAFNVAEIEEVA